MNTQQPNDGRTDYRFAHDLNRRDVILAVVSLQPALRLESTRQIG